jgi:hypothetical protein
MSNKISTDEITSPVLISTSNYTNLMNNKENNGVHNNINSINILNNNNRKESTNSIIILNNKNRLADKLNAVGGLKQKSFSFLMSKQLIKQSNSTSRTSSLSSSLSASLIDQSTSSSKSNLLNRQNSTANLSSRGNFIKTKSSLS